MDSIWNGFANILLLFGNQLGGMVPALVIVTVFVCFVTYPMTKKSVENILISELMRVDMMELRERHKKHPEKAETLIQALLATRHYGMFASNICTVLQGVLGVLIALAFRAPVLAGKTEGPFGLDLALSPDVLRNTSPEASMAVVVLVLGAIGLQLIHDRVMEKDLITEQRVQDLILLALVAAGSVFLPSAFALYWVAHELADIAMLLLIPRFTRDRFFARIRAMEGKK